MSHYDAVVELLEAAAEAIGRPLHKGHVPNNPTYPYAVLFWPGVPRRVQDSMTGKSDRLEQTFRITSVGLTDESVRVVAQAMQDAVLDQFVLVSGWETGQILHRGTDVAIQEDRDVTDEATGRHPLYTVDAYQLAAARAA